MENRHPMSASPLGGGGGYNVFSDGEAPRGGEYSLEFLVGVCGWFPKL